MKKLLLFAIPLLLSNLLLAQNPASFSSTANWQNSCSNGDSILFNADYDSTGIFTGKGITDFGNGVSSYSPVKAGAGIDTVSYTVFDTLDFKQLSLGGHHSCFISNYGKLFTVGLNMHGQLGDGTFTDRGTLAQVGAEYTWSFISAGYDHNLAIKTDGSLWAWGWNQDGEIGDGTSTNRSSPVQVGNDSTWEFMSAGYNHSIGLKTDGTMWGWGKNTDGQLGDGTLTNRNTPVKIGQDSTWKFIASGMYYNLAIKKDGSLWTWGYNIWGQLGDGTTTNRNIPFQIGNDTTWKQVSTKLGTSIALKANGTIWTWGRNTRGQLGDGTTNNRSTPAQVGQDSTWSAVSTGSLYCMGIKENGSLWAWGNNNAGQLGDGTNTTSSTPVQAGQDTSWKMIFSGDQHSIAFKEDSSLWVWGDNSYGQLGDTSINYFNQNSPQKLVVLDTNTSFKIITVSSPTDSTISQASCNSFNWQQNNITYTSSGTYKDTIMNVAGCDSVVTLNLTINNLDTIISKIQDTLFVPQSNATYQWLNCDSAMAVIPNATAQSFIPTIDGNYACEITTSSCIDTTRCIQWIHTGIKENRLLQIAIYPNPFQDNIQFNLGELQGETILKVLNTNGQLITTAKMQKNHFSLDTKNWSRGVYFIQLFNAKSSRTIKLIK